MQLGPKPGLPDALAYYLVWFLRDRMNKKEHFLDQFKNLLKWEQLVKAIGHGTPEPMEDLDALDIAKNSTPKTIQQVDRGDTLGLNIGDFVSVMPASGSVIVSGTLNSISTNHVSLLRTDRTAGVVCVHFPRVGYRILVG